MFNIYDIYQTLEKQKHDSSIVLEGEPIPELCGDFSPPDSIQSLEWGTLAFWR